MKNVGQPKSAPGWYRPSKESYIEVEFSKELGDLADRIEKESWFGDKEKHGRYRVDFILKDVRLIIELDGHAYHSSPEQLEKDAIRQRYLTRAGYTVIRFTGREVNRDAASCVEEVRTIYNERLQREPAKYRVMYIDFKFLINEIAIALNFFQELHPWREFEKPPIEDFIFSAIEWLHEKSYITAFIFHNPEDKSEVSHLNGLTKDFSKGEVRINTISDVYFSVVLAEHMASFAHLYDQFLVVADDLIYVESLLEVLPNASGKLLRKGNHETAYLGTDLVKYHWQDIYYSIGHVFGLELYEM